MFTEIDYNNSLCHYGIKGQEWGERRYQNEDGSYTPLGREHRARVNHQAVVVNTKSNKSGSTTPKKTTSTSSASTDEKKTETTQAPTNQNGGTNKVLKRGQAGDDIKQLQTMLKAAGYDLGKHDIDGRFGPDTLAAVRKYQQDKGLKVDGLVGPETMKALTGGGSETKTETTSSNNSTESKTTEKATKSTSKKSTKDKKETTEKKKETTSEEKKEEVKDTKKEETPKPKKNVSLTALERERQKSREYQARVQHQVNTVNRTPSVKKKPTQVVVAKKKRIKNSNLNVSASVKRATSLSTYREQQARINHTPVSAYRSKVRLK